MCHLSDFRNRHNLDCLKAPAWCYQLPSPNLFTSTRFELGPKRAECSHAFPREWLSPRTGVSERPSLLIYMKYQSRWLMWCFCVAIPSFVARPRDRPILFVKRSCYSSNKLSVCNNVLHYFFRSISGWIVSVNIYSKKKVFIKQELDFLENTANSATTRRSWRSPKIFYCNLFLTGIKLWSDWL